MKNRNFSRSVNDGWLSWMYNGSSYTLGAVICMSRLAGLPECAKFTQQDLFIWHKGCAFLVSAERRQHIWASPLAFNLFHSTVDFIGSIFIPRSGWFLPLHVSWAARKRNCSGIFRLSSLECLNGRNLITPNAILSRSHPTSLSSTPQHDFLGLSGTTPKKYFIFSMLCVHSHPQLWASYSKYMRTFQCFIDPLFSSQITYRATPTKLKTNLHFIYLTYPSRRCDTRNSGISLHTKPSFHVWFPCYTARVYFEGRYVK